MSDIVPNTGADITNEPIKKADDPAANATVPQPAAPAVPYPDSAGMPQSEMLVARSPASHAAPPLDMLEPESSELEEKESPVEPPPPPAKKADRAAGKNVKGVKGAKDAKAAKAPQDDTTGGPLMTVLVRNEFYRDGFRNMMWLAVIEAVAIAGLLVAFISFMNTTKAQDHYFATTADGRIIQLVPLGRPNMNTSALLSWAAQAAQEVMTFGFDDYQRRLQQSSRFFTRHGWQTFASALQSARIIESITALNQVVSAVPRSAPILTQEGVYNGKFRWIVQLPLSVTYQSGTATRTDSMNVTLVIDRVPSLENPSGVGIDQWIASTNVSGG